MGNDSELSIIVRARNEASKVLNEVMNDAKGVGSTIKKGFADAVPASAALAAGVAAVGAASVAFGVSSVNAYMDAQNASAQLEAVIKSTGAAAGLTAQDLQEQATALQSVTKFSDEAVMATQSMLLTFTNLKGGVMQEATVAALDMAQALGMEGSQAAMQLGKALNDPANGMAKLQRVGVTFTDSQKKAAEQMVKTGDVAGAQRLILAELSKEFGGSAEAAGKTFAGQMEILKNQFGDLQEEVGKVILEGLRPLMDVFGQFIDDMNEAGGIIPYLTQVFNENRQIITIVAGAILAGLIPALVAAAGAMWAFISPLLPFLAVGAAVGFLVDQLARKMGGWGELLKEAKGWFDNVMLGAQVFIDAFKDPDITSDGWVGAIEQIAGVARQLFDFLLTTGQQAWAGLQAAVQFLMPSLQALASTIVDRLWPALLNLWNTLAPILIPALKVLAVIIGVAIVGALYVFINVLNIVISVVSWFSNLLMGLVKVVSTVVMGIVAYIQMLWQFWSTIFGAMYETVKFTFQLIAIAIAIVVSLIMAIVQPIGQALSAPFRAAADFVRGIWNGIVGFFGGIAGSVGRAIGGVFDAIASPFNRAVEFVKQIPGRIVSAIGNIGSLIRNTIGNFDIPGPLGKVRDVIPGFASGVQNFGGGLAVVGERGPELVNLPRGSDVIPNGQTQQMLGGTTITNQFFGTIKIDTPEAADRFFDRLNRDAEMASIGVPT